eukprot:2016898-Pleurochrysis_carterae.AAC.1
MNPEQFPQARRKGQPAEEREKRVYYPYSLLAMALASQKRPEAKWLCGGCTSSLCRVVLRAPGKPTTSASTRDRQTVALPDGFVRVYQTPVCLP